MGNCSVCHFTPTCRWKRVVLLRGAPVALRPAALVPARVSPGLATDGMVIGASGVKSTFSAVCSQGLHYLPQEAWWWFPHYRRADALGNGRRATSGTCRRHRHFSLASAAPSEYAWAQRCPGIHVVHRWRFAESGFWHFVALGCEQAITVTTTARGEQTMMQITREQKSWRIDLSNEIIFLTGELALL